MRKALELVMPARQIRFKAMGVFIHEGKILASKGHDSHGDPFNFYRLVGGTIEFGETAEQAIHREILEELGTEIENVKLLDVVENIFQYEGRDGHQVIFLFSGDFVNKDLYQQETIKIHEVDYDAPDAYWISCQDVIDGKVILYPEFNYKKLLSQLTE